MSDEDKKYRLVLFVNPNAAIDFFGGRTVASPLAFYYFSKKKGKVVWGDSIKRVGGYTEKGGFGISELREIAEKKGSDEILISDLEKEGYNVSEFGYIYQPFDPAMDSVCGVAWEFKIDQFVKGVLKIYEKYRLPASQIGVNEDRKCWCNHSDRYTNQEWLIILRDIKMLKTRIIPENQRSFGFKVGGNYFFKSDDKWDLSCGVRPTWIHLERSKKWPGEYVEESELSCSSIVTQEILNNHIHESLIHEILKVLFVREGWYMNYEMPVTYEENGVEKRAGNIDFLIKQSENYPWRVIEVKLADNPNAIEQLKEYMIGIKKNVRKIKMMEGVADSHFWLIAGGKKGSIKQIEGIILCPENAKDETEKEAKKENIKVWTYSLDIPKKMTISFEVNDENENLIVSSMQRNPKISSIT